MFRFSCLLLSLLIIAGCCQGFKIYFDLEDTYEDPEEILKDVKYEKMPWIFPGTKWCGTGSIAENENDLGSAIETDTCCREHDMCNDIIEAGQTKYNLTNNSYYTKLNCKCDERFYDCLKSSLMKTSRAVGHIYFNVLGTQCYRLDYPIIKCSRYDRFLVNRCVEYQFDTSKPQIYEWFDVPRF